MTNEKGYRAQCINVGATINLKKYEYYYVYPGKKDNLYVSASPYSRHKHFGCYNKLHFRIIDEIPHMEESQVNEKPPVEEVQEVVAAPENHEQMSLF